jgi:Ca2+-binding RTX toxin-like protein
VVLGAGDDTLTATGLTVDDEVRIDAGRGTDVLTLATLAADELFASLGAGDDSLTASAALTLTTRARIEGNAGNDTLTGEALITSALNELLGIETINV